MALLQTPDQVADACGDDPTWICRQVLESTDSEGWARASDVLVAKPAHILLILVVAWVANRLLHRAIRRFTERIANPEAQDRIQRLRQHAPDALQSPRRSVAPVGGPGHRLCPICCGRRPAPSCGPSPAP